MKTLKRKKALEDRLAAASQPLLRARWQCSKCGQVNSDWATTCGRCNTPIRESK